MSRARLHVLHNAPFQLPRLYTGGGESYIFDAVARRYVPLNANRKTASKLTLQLSGGKLNFHTVLYTAAPPAKFKNKFFSNTRVLSGQLRGAVQQQGKKFEKRR